MGSGRQLLRGSGIGAAFIAASVAMLILLPGGAAASSREASATFTAPCVVGPGLLNVKTTMSISIHASGPEIVALGGELTFGSETVTINTPRELANTFSFLGSTSVRGSIENIGMTSTNATPGELNAARPAAFPEGLPFETPVTAEQTLTLLAPSQGSPSFGPLHVTASHGESVTVSLSSAPGFEEAGLGEYKETGAGIISSISGYNGEGTKVIGPLAVVCNAPPVTFAEVSTVSRTITCTHTTHTPYPPGSIEPHEGPASGGTPVTIYSGSPGSPTAVEFGGVEVPFTESGAALSAKSPPGTGTVHVYVATECDGREFAGNFTYISSITAHGPEITGIEPKSGPERGGTTVTLSGHNFTGTESVLFGKQPATSFKVNSASSITAVAPPGKGSVIVRAVGYGVDEEQEVRFFYQQPVKPRLTSVEPGEGPPSGGTKVTIEGTNFEEVKSVAFGSKEATSFTVNSPTSITATDPSGSGQVAVTVTAAAGASEPFFSGQFSYAPSVTSLEPNEGAGGGGTKVMIEGTNFYEIRSVAFGSKPATSFTVNSPTSITAIAPSGSGTADLTVTGGGGTSVRYFSYAPNVTTVTPAHGPVRGGNQVTITGTDFREVTSVAFGPHNATSFTVKSPTSITAIAPAGSGRVSVTITTVGGTSEATPEDRYLYVLPGPRVSAWGANERGQLGAGLTQTGFPECDCSPLPQEVIDLGEVSAVATGSRSSDSLALLKNGTVMAWGDGFLGNGDALLPEQCFLDRCSTFPVQVSGLNEVTAVATGGKDSLALLRGGKVMAWGSNLYGGLGDGKRGSEGEVVADVPTPVSGLSEVSAIAVGANHDLALLKNGTVMAWGDNSDGELGDGTTTERDSPVKVTGLGEIVAIAAGYNFSLALKRDGTVMAWGRNSSGQLGDGTSTGPGSCGTESPCSTTPVAVIGLSGVRSISAGFENGLADLTNGTVKAWGGSVPDVLGTNSELGESTTPVTVLGLSEAIAVAAVEYGGLALNANGTVMTWGDDTRGEIGDGTVNSLFSPITTVDDLGHAVSIAAGESFNLAVVTETEPLAFKAWALSGTITPKPLGQAISLPSGSSFNGSGELNTETNEGTASGTIAVPPFKASPKLFGVIPVSLGMTVTQSGAIGGTIAPSKTVPGDETLTLPVKLNLGFTSFGLLGLNIPTNCATSQPVSLTLTDTLTKEALVSKGWAFSGTGTIPKITCQGGLLGALYGGTISELISGAGASYSLSVKAPGS